MNLYNNIVTEQSCVIGFDECRFFHVGKLDRFEVRISLLWVKLWLTNKVRSRVIAFAFEIFARISDCWRNS